VIISYVIGQQLTWQQIAQRQKLNRQWGALFKCLPVRVEATHLCADTMIWRTVFAIFKYATNFFVRMRAREHFGTHQEVKLSLQTFGIPMLGFPVNEDGEIQAHLGVERWEKRHKLELLRKEAAKSQEPEKDKTIQTPTQDDVLLGRGKAFYSHVGNVRLRNIVIEMAGKYNSAGFSGKQKVSDEIVDYIKARGGRFLKDGGAGWMEVDNDTAQKKVSHAFRTLRSMKRSAETKMQGSKRRLDTWPEHVYTV